MAAKFLTDLKVVELDDNRSRLLDYLVYRSCIPGVGVIAVPPGEVTDYASIPRLPLMYWLLGGRYKKEAVVHDYLYRTKLHSRRIADAVIAEAIAARGSALEIISAKAVWLGVRIGGGSHYG